VLDELGVRRVAAHVVDAERELRVVLPGVAFQFAERRLDGAVVDLLIIRTTL